MSRGLPRAFLYSFTFIIWNFYVTFLIQGLPCRFDRLVIVREYF